MKQVQLRPTERIDDLLTYDLKIIQSDEVFSFSLDAVLLGRFCSVAPKGRMIDLCTGNGVVPLLLTTRTRAEIWGVEIQERLADMAVRNAEINGLEERLHMLQGDLKTIHETLGHGQFDAVTVNPPYLPVPNGEQNVNEHFAAARHEIYCNLEDVIAASAKLVKAGGKVAMVHRATRLIDICCLMRQYRLEPKRIRYVHARAGEEAMMVLIEGMKDGKPEIRTLPPLIVYDDNQEYCKELKEIYYGGRSSLEFS
ncbi:tRNA1(Val) (adenine(37)-N6)-methyltransferase [Paenibacillus alginolyticus]|jgi:tRNA1(Val) A37 N6-methylase TrmN6|uniref:tRNA1(Val) (Adenine(37)-N6)-methyltransferase n=1 Tax=Paenibacillus alginolyticus TaxID=59839 RepID=A0ABT4GFM5_9BACL|nr:MULTISPECIES: tRNA1(Val) (adenine(37)-N6)-methyltransferase [Paenibacillus]MCY9669247.1 tRNA1(Val) (adenine(37)-N6)-methyltransferase [Paenibacillus alginolyticus]MCY9694863.1 tRNA1(Val) (adenine(37)-N6)-methyltransferase [Paenibacillus alginolyticus]MEC0147257.1 tRNA1(Val) (adenine(37)-N6)-methyltransferase [Paenibacillus alginolyticus]NRF94749.1 tRNA1(Val) (adenine(37)-N6)-methyltransferase [Paenibacillus frigoriresistens]